MSWNHSSQSTVTPKKSSSGLFLGYIALALVLAGLVVFFLTRPAEEPIVKEEPKTIKKIDEVAPPPKPQPLPPVEAKPKRPIRSNEGAKTYIDEKGVKRYEGGARVFDRPRRKPINLIKADEAIFHNYAENQIYALLSTNPGDTVFVTRKYDKRFLDAFKKSLEEPIIPEKEDDEYERAAKQMMNEVKAELAERMRKGEDVCKIMDEAYSELQRLASVKRDILQVAREAVKGDDQITESDAIDILNAANKMLSDKGIAPLSKNSILTKNLRLKFLKRDGK